MYVFRQRSRPIASIVALSFFFLTVIISPIQATMINTTDVLQLNNASYARENVRLFLGREDVQQQLVAWGVDSDLAVERVDTLSDEEVISLSRRINELPAGGDALGSILGVVFVIFLVLLVTDILGLTDVFPFVRR